MSQEPKRAGRIGLMLYTVRRACADDFEGVLREVAATGYEGVELFELHGHEPDRVRAWLDGSGLVACGRHARLEAIETELEALAAEAQALGWRRLVVSWLPPTDVEEQPDELRERLAQAGRAAAEAGLELGFHNHAAEVRPGPGGRSFLDDLPQELFLELDLGWAWWAGADPVELLEGLPGRVPLVHVKDFPERGVRTYCPVGDGAVDFARIVPAVVRAGVEWLLVEQDETDGDELAAARRSFAALERLL
jgi:sugar phosphate isomerase/epimerase